MATAYRIKLLAKNQVAEGTTEFTLEKPAGLEYRAGQYCNLMLPASTGLAGGDRAHKLSLLSAPFEDTLRVATRMRAGSVYKAAAAALPLGSELQLFAPFGDFTLQKSEKVPAVFLIGGIGITPVRSIIAQASHDGTGHHIILLYSNRNPGTAAYVADFQQFAQANSHFTFVPSYSDTDGFIDADMVRANVPDIETSRFYMCGPDVMVKAMRKLLLEVGADEDLIKTEEFDGY